MTINAGDAVPAVELYYDFPPTKINVAEYTKGKKIVLLGMPGAFTPTWCVVFPWDGS